MPANYGSANQDYPSIEGRRGGGVLLFACGAPGHGIKFPTGCCFLEAKNDREKIHTPRCTLVLGLLLLIVGCTMAGIQLKRQLSWTSATGNVIRTERCPEGDTLRAIIQYTIDDATYRIDSNWCSSSPPRVGSDVAVLYDPQDPAHAIDASFASAWLFPIFFGVLGIAFSKVPPPSIQKNDAGDVGCDDFDQAVLNARGNRLYSTDINTNFETTNFETYEGDFDIKYEHEYDYGSIVSEFAKIRLTNIGVDGYKIEGNCGRSTITEGFASYSGNAWWVERSFTSGSRLLTRGAFDFTSNTFSGTWIADAGACGSYTEFRGRNVSKTFPIGEATVAHAQTLNEMLTMDIPMAFATPVSQSVQDTNVHLTALDVPMALAT